MFTQKDHQIECLDYKDLIKKYDTTNTLFYLDPPYMVKGANSYYKVNWDVPFHKELSEILHNIKGKFVLSYYENDYIRDWYKDCNFTYKKAFVSSNKNNPKYKIECLIRNF